MAVRTNQITNPSFETNTTGWTANGGATLSRVSTTPHVGSWCGEVVCTAVANSGVQPNTYTVGVGLPVAAAVALRWVSGATDIVVELRNQAGTVIATQAVTLTVGYQTILVAGTTPSGTTSVHVRTNRVAASAHTYRVDAAILEQAATTSFFSGDTVDDLVYTYAWTGTANGSTSTATENAPIVVTGHTDADPSPRVEIVQASIPAAGVSTTVERIWDGRRAVVRGARLASSPSGFTVTDYEAPLGMPVSYVATSYDINGGAVSQSPESAQVTLTFTDPSAAWISDPLAPILAKQVRLMAGTESLTYPLDAELVSVVGRREQIGLVGTRRAATGVTVRIEALSMADAEQIKEIMDQAAPLLVRTHPRVRLPRLAYMLSPDTSEDVRDYWAEDPSSVWVVAGSLVAPQGASVVVPVHMWAEVVDTYATWADLVASKATWLDVIRNPQP